MQTDATQERWEYSHSPDVGWVVGDWQGSDSAEHNWYVAFEGNARELAGYLNADHDRVAELEAEVTKWQDLAAEFGAAHKNVLHVDQDEWEGHKTKMAELEQLVDDGVEAMATMLMACPVREGGAAHRQAEEWLAKAQALRGGGKQA